ncbi:hypothetical protein HMPREF9413_2424 [Paenibacillus sp. HGF7]|nr:hypothetical protein HMPREF9413_2424 [Paenibacillus sp. HGF7]
MKPALRAFKRAWRHAKLCWFPTNKKTGSFRFSNPQTRSIRNGTCGFFVVRIRKRQWKAGGRTTTGRAAAGDL